MSKLLDALNGKNRATPPVWLMRQAGRYMRSYRDLKEKYSFLELCHNSDLATTITLLPIKELEVDAAILFADILLILEAFNISFTYKEKIGPVIHSPINNKKEIEELKSKDINSSFQYISKTIRNLKKELNVPLIGFSGAPFTVATYLIEGQTSKTFQKTKKLLYQEPEAFHLLLEKITQATIEYLKLQIDAGANCVQIFDSWAYALPYNLIKPFALDYTSKINTEIKKLAPTIIFGKGYTNYLEDLVNIDSTAISIDWSTNILSIKDKLPKKISIQGNFDPFMLYAPKDLIKKRALELLDAMKGHRGYIFNLGHGLLPDTPYENVKYLVELVKSYE